MNIDETLRSASPEQYGGNYGEHLLEQYKLYVEMADRETPPEDLRGRVPEGLVAMGVIDRPERVLFMEPRRTDCAYVIYDFDYHESRERIHRWLGGVGVQSIGRYGDWNYSAMEDALIAGRRAAQRLCTGPGERQPQ